MNVMLTSVDPRIIDALARLAKERGITRAELMRRCLYTCVHSMVREAREPRHAPKQPWARVKVPSDWRVMCYADRNALVQVDRDGLLKP